MSISNISKGNKSLFEAVAQLVREFPEVSGDATSNVQKLRLYGLFKRITEGACSEATNQRAPSVLQVVARSKRNAWKDYDKYTVDQAINEYIGLIASRQDELGRKCRHLQRDDNQGRPDFALLCEERSPLSVPTTLPYISTVEEEESRLPSVETALKTNVLSVWDSCWTMLASTGVCILQFIGIRPLVPRGRLDLSYFDLFYALRKCCQICNLNNNLYQCQQISREICQLWKETTGQAVTVGLSVRSLFDLYLTTKHFAAGSQVIVVPPISVPGMMHVLKYHNLEVVPVDMGESHEDWCDMESIAQAITKQTVAIMVVHPFGRLAASESKFRELRTLAEAFGLELWEDCAECFMGLGKDCYLGTPLADVRLFSFGMIKTVTALGGGVISFRDQSAQKAVDRLQRCLSGQQTTSQFLGRVVLSTVLNFIADSPWRVGLLASACSMLGADFDLVVTKSLRGFRIPSYTNEKRDGRVHEGLATQIRKRPCHALLALLLRRFQKSKERTPSVESRIARCKSMDQILSKLLPNICIAHGSNLLNSYWAFPMSFPNRETISFLMTEMGFDVVSGASQLCCVSSFASEAHSCPRAERLMDSILYLPIASRSCQPHELKRLTEALKYSLDQSAKTRIGGRENHGESDIVLEDSSFLAAPYIMLWCLPVVAVLLRHVLGFKFGFSQVVSAIIFVSVSWAGTLGLLVLFLWTLRWKMATFYLKESSSFAEHCDMVDAASSQEQYEDCVTESLNVLSQIKALRLPSVEANSQKNEGRTVVLTGATGFVGSLVLRDLLLHRELLSLRKVIVLCRDKKTEAAESRITSLLAKPMFSFLSLVEKARFVEVIKGDVTERSVGLSEQNLGRLYEDQTISHVIHAAAAVGFTLDLPDAAKSNISSSLNMQVLTSGLYNKEAKFVHISTAFVHGGQYGSSDSPLPEELFPLGQFSAREIYRSMLGTQYYATKAMTNLQFPNSYALSKCICEHLLLQQKDSNTIIIRPSIVGPAIESPFEGWAGEKPSTIVAGACLHLSHQWNLWYLAPNSVAYIPVDVLSRFVLAKAFQEICVGTDTASSSDGSFERISAGSETSSETDYQFSTTSKTSSSQMRQAIFNASWDASAPDSSSFSWLEFSVSYLHLGCMLGYFDRWLAYLTLLVSARWMPQYTSSSASYHQVHASIVRAPILGVIALLEKLHVTTKAQRKILPFLDLPLLFFPFMKRNFYFQSSLVPPSSFDAKRYVFGTAVAAHRFISESRIRDKKKEKKNSPRILSEMVVGGSTHEPMTSDLFWAISQPTGDVVIRICAWFFVKILRRVTSAVTVDTGSFRSILPTMKRSSTREESYLVLAPTHRSFFDFILVSYMIFALPELQLDCPVIIAADDFERVPFIGWLTRKLHVLYVRRGQGYKDSSLKDKIKETKEKRLSEGGSCIEIFLEGTRSRDRRFIEPKTGCLKCLNEAGGTHVVVPMTINYERIPEQRTLCIDAKGPSRRGMNVSGLMNWLHDVFTGKIHLGRIHIAAGKAVPMQCETSSDFRRFAQEIQRQHQGQLFLSDYHVQAAAKFLSIDAPFVAQAMEDLGCKPWPSRSTCPPSILLPEDKSELLTILLQASHNLAPLFSSSHPKWCKWLNHLESKNAVRHQSPNVHTQRLYESLASYFDRATSIVDKAMHKLKEKDFHQPQAYHILQTAAMIDMDVPTLLIQAAIQMTELVLSDQKLFSVSDVLKHPLLSPDFGDLRLPTTEERLGFWGFGDSGFVLKSHESGRTVTMTGDKYTLCGRSIRKLLPFMESEMEVQINPLVEFPTVSPIWSSSIPVDLNSIDCEFLEQLGASISFETVERVRHGTGHSQEDVFAIRSGVSIRIPDSVVWIASEQQAEELIRTAKARKWCLIPFGGGTNVSNATRCPDKTIEPRPIISVDLKEMRQVLWLNEEDGLAHVQAGITGRHLVEELERRGYTMGHEPDSIEFSTLGGWIATKASGMKRSRYGNIEDIVLSVRVAGSQGMLWKGHDQQEGCPGRIAEGPDVRSLVIGSEGCLGIITSAIIRIWPLPEIRKFDSVLFPSFEDGFNFVRAVAKTGVHSPASVRLLDNAHFRLGQALRPHDSSMFSQAKDALLKLASSVVMGKLDEKAVVCATIGYEGSQAEVALQEATIQKLAKQNGGLQLGSKVGQSGYELTYMIAYLRDFAMTYHLLGESFETFCPWSKLEALIPATKERIRKEHKARLLPGVPFVGCRVTQLYHEGACLYFYLCISFEGVPDASAVFSELESAARDEILKQGGSLSHHHGIGKHRVIQLRGRASPAFEMALQHIKESVDQDNIFGARNGPFAFDTSDDSS